jgi:hypothetical protein
MVFWWAEGDFEPSRRRRCGDPNRGDGVAGRRRWEQRRMAPRTNSGRQPRGRLQRAAFNVDERGARGGSRRLHFARRPLKSLETSKKEFPIISKTFRRPSKPGDAERRRLDGERQNLLKTLISLDSRPQTTLRRRWNQGLADILTAVRDLFDPETGRLAVDFGGVSGIQAEIRGSAGDRAGPRGLSLLGLWRCSSVVTPSQSA